MTDSDPSRTAVLAGNPWADKYPARAVPWDWNADGDVDILDDDGSVVVGLIGWQTVVFHGADGNRTLEQFISSTAKDYRGGPVPDDLGVILVKEFRYLLEDLKVVELRDAKGEIPENHEFPQSELPLER